MAGTQKKVSGEGPGRLFHNLETRGLTLTNCIKLVDRRILRL